jgi:hypothetical protein
MPTRHARVPMRDSISGEKNGFLSEFAKLFDVLNSDVDVGSLLG